MPNHHFYEVQSSLVGCITTDVALNPNAFGMAELRDLHVATLHEVSIVAGSLIDEEWIEKDDANKYVTTTRFWKTYHDTLQRSSEILWGDQWLFNEAVEQRRLVSYVSAHGPETTREGDGAFSIFSGHTDLLGRRHDLGRAATWLSGKPGWELLATVNALSNPKPAPS